MKPMIPLLLSMAFVAANAVAADSHAQQQAKPAAAPMAIPAPMSSGEVKKIDAAAGKITIAHGPLYTLRMPPMTMTFKVLDRAQLKGIGPGDSVRFVAEESGGEYVVTRLAKGAK